MTNTRFTVEPTNVDSKGNEHVGWVIHDGFTGSLVRNGKEEIIFVDGSNVAEVAEICDHMNTMTAGISIGDSVAFIPREAELAAA